MRTLLCTLAVLSTACAPSAKKQVELGRDISQDYIESVCSFWMDETCLENMREVCGDVFSFRSMDDCVSLYTDLTEYCPDSYFTFLWESEGSVQECIDAIDGWDCDNDPLCTADAGVFDTGPCGQLDKAYNDSCF